MTANRRIILNTLATYGRSLLSLFLGLFSARWVLLALGETDLGIFGVVGSIILCIQLLNIVMSTAVARFFAFTIGEAKNMDPVSARKLLMDWFNAAMLVHLTLPIVLSVIGYPIGVWLINNWLVVPEGRIDACIWVFRFSLISAFVGMVSVPYIAMYRARQLIAELTVWEVIRTIVVFGGAFSLLYFGGDKLIVYAAIMSFAPVVVLCIQVYRAYVQFDCCRVRFSRLFCCDKIRRIVAFGCCDLFSSLGCIVRDQGAAFVLNKVFGPAVNSAYGIANQLSAQTNTLAGAMNGALLPAITTCEGEGSSEKAVTLAHRSCKYCTLMVLIFAVPLAIEADEVLRLWLVSPPKYTVELCRCALLTAICFKLGWGYHMAILAKGKVAFYQMTIGTISIATLLVMLILTKYLGVLGVGYALVINAFLLSVIRVLYGKVLVGVGVVYWLSRVLFPVSAVILITLIVGIIPYFLFDPSFARIIVTTAVSFLGIGVSSWVLLLDAQEKHYIFAWVSRFVKLGTKNNDKA